MSSPSRRRVVAFIPPACCGAGYFRKVRRALGDRLDVHAIELPGRGRRHREPFLIHAARAAEDLAEQIAGPVDAIYGESLGAYLALAVAAGPRRSPPPILLVASNSPPSARESQIFPEVSSLDEAISALRRLGGDISEDVTADPNLASRAYPLVRADVRLSLALIESLRETSVPSDIRVLGGRDDAGLSGLESWSSHTTGHCDVTWTDGGHLLSAAAPAKVARFVLESMTLA